MNLDIFIERLLNRQTAITKNTSTGCPGKKAPFLKVNSQNSGFYTIRVIALF